MKLLSNTKKNYQKEKIQKNKRNLSIIQKYVYANLMKQYHEEDFQFNLEITKATSLFCKKVLSMTGKRRENIRPIAGKQHG